MAGEGLFHASFSLGRVAGVSIGVNWSWLLVLMLVTLSLATTVFPEQSPGLSGPAYVVMAVAAAVLFFACLLLHELGHAVVARREGMEIEGITLWVFGGVARFKGMFPSAGAEFRIAIAGPLVTLALSLVLIAAASALRSPAAIDGVVAWLGWMNLILLVFNMLPALPLDGGRVLRAALWHRLGDFSRATRIAGGLGRAFGHALIVGGVLLFVMGAPGGLWFAFIGWFLAVSAQAEAQLGELREAPRRAARARCDGRGSDRRSRRRERRRLHDARLRRRPAYGVPGGRGRPRRGHDRCASGGGDRRAPTGPSGGYVTSWRRWRTSSSSPPTSRCSPRPSS